MKSQVHSMRSEITLVSWLMSIFSNNYTKSSQLSFKYESDSKLWFIEHGLLWWATEEADFFLPYASQAVPPSDLSQPKIISRSSTSRYYKKQNTHPPLTEITMTKFC